MAGDREVILITGCSGRIGFRVAERFANDFNIAGFDLILAGHLPDVNFMLVDMASDAGVKEGLKRVKEEYGGKIASVIHLAAYYNFTGGGEALYDRITVQGTRRLLEGLKDFEVGQFIFSSTMLVYAPCKPTERINENWPLQPKWEYPKSKVKTENLIHQMRGNIPTVIMRIAGVYDDHCHSIPIGQQIQRIYEKQLESHLFSGDLTHGSSFIHMEDLVEAIWLSVQKRKQLPSEHIINIGEPETFSYDELQKEIGSLLYGKEWKTYSIPKFLAKIGAWVQNHLPFMKKSFIKPWMIDVADDNFTLDITLASKTLGWTPKHSLKDALPIMIAELKRDPRTFYDENHLS